MFRPVIDLSSKLGPIESNLAGKQGGKLYADPAYTVDRTTKTPPMLEIGPFPLIDQTRVAIKRHPIDIASLGRVNPTPKTTPDAERPKSLQSRDFKGGFTRKER